MRNLVPLSRGALIFGDGATGDDFAGFAAGRGEDGILVKVRMRFKIMKTPPKLVISRTPRPMNMDH